MRAVQVLLGLVGLWLTVAAIGAIVWALWPGHGWVK
jgi:hypothetical protein